MAIWTRTVFAVGVGLLAAACSTTTPGTAPGTGPAAHDKTVTHQAVAPAVSATPGTRPGAATGLAHSALLSTSWVNATQGWALAAQPCGGGTCARLARTTDAGRHWQRLPDPPAAVLGGTVDCLAARACVSQVSFASPAIGYLYGPSLLMTTDGGLTWHARPGLETETLTIAGGQAYRVAYTSGGCPGPCRPSLQEAPVGSASWRTLIARLVEPDRSGSAQIAVSGPDVLVAMYGSLAGPVLAQADVYRSADGGGTWRQADDPCGPSPRGPGLGGPGAEKDLIGLAAPPGGFVAGLCITRATMGTFVITSTDAGATWRATTARPPGQGLGFITAASPATIAIASGATGGSGAYTARLLVTTDGGRRWVTVATDTQDLAADGAPAWAGFETTLAGQWLGDPHGVWTTADGGLRWTRTAFR